ncbi:glycoside hydrolase family 38 C-terminal domain-containing protein [Glutamicibacter protophormiae]|uniref:alpha-mannosidase n=1 Tax=Glutamicibacter protophormiae TaxID=37930 RepID=UPI002A7ED6CE|nr:glycoside hydrolase family 38 C-terminal domain-containing protein [Glutamicibacter protophormiae]WPR65391.1 glycoside hydrolase family 38 C-terminal domain-containing protein [Glutamicibacter protophormiae]WPR68889.1 glycoside hydrolase family 38 C-terminal domain-containing protein [Glutamicibacter protophormiae]
MHDDTSLTIGRVKRVLDERIRPAIYSESVPLQVSWHELPGEPVAPAEGLALDYTPVAVGTPWGAAWGTTWFHLQGEVPAAWAGRRVEAVIDLGFDINMTGFQCEGLIYRPDGITVKALNPRNQWVPVAESAAGGEVVDLYMEAASNPVLLDYHPFLPTEQGDILTSSSRRLYTLRRLELAVFEPVVHDLALDLEVLFDLQEQLADGPRRFQILQAMDNALDVLDLQRITETAQDARDQLAAVLAAPAEHSAHKISAIGHSHIDSAWLWPLRETIRKVSRTCSSMVELLETEDEFLYGMSSAQQYKWLKTHRPEVWDRVKRQVAEGRFLPLGGMWVESDTVMPSGESLVRQFLYGQNFFRKEFGITSKGVWLPDSFGYSPALPQLMRRAGFEWFFTQKISWNQQNKFPHHTFDWEGIDGSRMFSHFPSMDTYNSQLSGEEVAKAARQFREARVTNNSIAPVGWGDGGGGTTREMTGKAKRLANLEGSATVAWEHPNDFFDRAKAELPNPPVWVGELYLELHRATLTSQHQTKQGNRRTEQLLVEAELWASTAAVYAGEPYPYEQLDELWETVLLHQFHDILPGTSIAWVHREVVARYAEVITQAQALIARAQQVLSGTGGLQLEFNAAAYTRHGVAFGAARELEPATAQLVRAEALDGGYVLGNELVRVVINSDGLITSAVDLATGRETIAEGKEANLLQLHQDFPNMWDAWDVDKYYRNQVTDLRAADGIQLSESGGTATVTVTRSFSNSTLVQELSLAPGERTVQISQSTDWHEAEKFLKVAFPLDIRAEQTIAETQFGYHQRVTHVNTSWEAAKFETSMHRFVLAQEPGFGAALVNDSIYGFDVTRDAEDARVTTTVRLSLLRAPRFPDPQTDQGLQTHRYGLVIGADIASATEAGALLNSAQTVRSGAREVEPLAAISGEGLVVSSVKLAADRSGDLVVRMYESLGRRASGTLGINRPVASAATASLLEDPLEPVEVNKNSVQLKLGAFEVRTLRFTLR